MSEFTEHQIETAQQYLVDEFGGMAEFCDFVRVNSSSVFYLEAKSWAFFGSPPVDDDKVEALLKLAFREVVE